MEDNLNTEETVREEINVTEVVGEETASPARTQEKETNIPKNLKPEAKPKEKQRKELTPAEMQRRKKMLVYPLIFILFAGAIVAHIRSVIGWNGRRHTRRIQYQCSASP